MPQVTDQQQKSQGKTIQFGVGQLDNPTPKNVKLIFRAILYLSAVWAVMSPSLTEISPAILASINKYLLLGTAIINVTIQFFGWDYKTS